MKLLDSTMSEKPLIFATFVFACVALGLLAGSLGSDYWVVASVHREANEKSEGWVNFGLFKVSGHCFTFLIGKLGGKLKIIIAEVIVFRYYFSNTIVWENEACSKIAYMYSLICLKVV